ncbi:MAG: type IV secretory system conjugative DNA transfer family protein [Clostridia bacterium]|nr:type IV secretory system conjugative DNA transfer family protein [Clostridia bacterium]
MQDYNAYKYSADETLLRGARWARDEEMMQVTRRIRLSDPAGVPHSGLPVISDGDSVYVDDSDTHSLIIGSTGSKKSRLFAMPMLEIMRRAGESAVVTDPKGELYELTASAFEQSGYRVEVINLREPHKSNGWNPLAMARAALRRGDPEKATSIVNDFAAAMLHGETGGGKNDAFWEHSSIAMLQGLALMMVEGTSFFPDDTVNLATLRHLSDNFRQADPRVRGGTGVLDLIELYPQTSISRQNLLVASHGTEGTFSNIKVSYEAPMQKLYMQHSLISMLSRSEVDFSSLGREKTVLYLIMPDEKTTLHKIVSLIIKLCYEQLIDLAQQHPRCQLPQRVNFLLDEFSNLPAIPDMAAMISAARSRNIKFHLIIQGLYQLSSKYGADNAHTIKGNCGNWAFLTSRELPLLNEISDLCGQDALTGERLITVSQLQRLNKDRGEVLMLVGRQCPYIAHLADIDEYVMPRNLPVRPYPAMNLDAPPTRTIAEILANAGSGTVKPTNSIRF